MSNWNARIQGDTAVARHMVMNKALQTFQAELWTAMPCIVQKVYNDKMMVDVQPTILINITKPDNTVELVKIPIIPDVPIIFTGGGGYTLTFPVAVGDECLAVFANRCIDAWWQNGGIQPQMEFRVHDLSDGFALIGVRSKPRLIDSGFHATAVQLRSDDGSIYFEIDPAANKARLQAPNVEIQTTENVHVTNAGSLTIDSTGDVTMNAPNLIMSGNGKFGGEVIAMNGGADEVHLSTHTQQDGGGTGPSGPPTPGS